VIPFQCLETPSLAQQQSERGTVTLKAPCQYRTRWNACRITLWPPSQGPEANIVMYSTSLCAIYYVQQFGQPVLPIFSYMLECLQNGDFALITCLHACAVVSCTGKQNGDSLHESVRHHRCLTPCLEVVSRGPHQLLIKPRWMTRPRLPNLPLRHDLSPFNKSPYARIHPLIQQQSLCQAHGWLF
jgi:hypothetical protein